jgi:ribosomal protein L37AE/L43A
MNKKLSQIVADLFAKSKGGEELSSKISRLRDEIKKITESEDAIFGKFRGLLESFREVIPEEKQRYHAAVKALSTTSKLNRQEIVNAVNNHLEELKILEKSVMPALPAWRDELKAMKAKAKQMRDEISKLREKIAQLESEEKEILNGTTAREREMELVEKALRELFADIGAEITHIKNKVEEYTAESTAVQPIPHRDAMKSDIPSKGKGGVEQKIVSHGSPAPQDTEWQKKCPMCGGRMNFHSTDKMWICYSCAYEELEKDEVHGESEEKNERTNAPVSETGFDPSLPDAVPLASLSSNENQESKKESSPSKSQPSTKTKTCPVCRKKMYWYPMEKAWRCPSCQYERRI